jgi:putative ABC transport system permease protein
VFYDYTSDQGTVFMAENVYRSYFNDPYISTLAVFLAAGTDYTAALDAVRGELIGTDLTAQSNRSLRDGAIEVFERTFSITQALRLLAVVVAFIGILSALMSLQIEQTRQYGTMRAVGLTRGQLWRFTLLQTGLMGFTAGLVALPIGAALAHVLIYVINVRSFGWTMQISLAPDEFLIAFFVALAAALLAGLYPARRIARLATATALKTE